MKHIKKFNLNEKESYSGSGKTIGFRYSEPKEEYIISVDMIINPELSIPKVRRDIKVLLKECGITENWYRLTKFNKEGDIEVPGESEGEEEVYTLAIGLTAFSRHEAGSALNSILLAMIDKYGEHIYFDEKHINLGGTDLDKEPEEMGFKVPEKTKVPFSIRRVGTKEEPKEKKTRKKK